MKANNSYSEGQAIAFHALDRLRMSGTSDYSVILFLLQLCRNKLFNLHHSEYLQVSSLGHTNRIFEFNSDVDNRELLLELFKIFEKDITSIDSQAFFDIVYSLSNLTDDWYAKHYSSLFEELLAKISLYLNSGQYSQPYEVTSLISNLSSYDHQGIVYNPFAGIVSYGVRMNVSSGYFAQEKNERTWAIGTLRLLAHNINTNNYVCQDSILHWKAKYRADDNDKLLFDLIIATPPFGMPVPYEEFWIEHSKPCNAEDFFIARGIKGLTPKGKLIGLFSTGVLFKGGTTELERKYAVDNDYLEMVISLPANLLYNTSIPSAVLIFNKNKPIPGHVKLVDGTSFIDRHGKGNVLLFNRLLNSIAENDLNYVRMVSTKEITDEDYNLSVGRYFGEKVDKMVIPEGYTLVKLGDLGSVYRGKKTEKSIGRIIRIKDLSSDILNFERSSTEFEIDKVSSAFQEIDTNMLLLSKIRTLKPTYCLASESESFLINNNIVAFDVDTTKIEIAYLILELNSQRTAKFVSARSTGITIPAISIKDLLEIPILIPDIHHQQQILVDEAIKRFQTEKIEELGFKLDQLQDSRRDVFEKNMHLRKHALSQVLNKFAPEFALLKLCKKKNGGQLSDGMVVSNRTGETVAECFRKLETLATKLEVLVNRLVDEQTYGDPEFIWIETFVEEYSNLHNPISFPVRFDYKCLIAEEDIVLGTEVFATKGDNLNSYAVDFSKKDLIQTLDNIVVNAEKYGFIEPTRLDYEVVITMEAINDQIAIKIANNGAPFHKSISIEKLFTWGGGNGTGLGLWQVKNIVEHFKGEVTAFDNKEDEYPVEFRITLPLSNTF